MSFSIQRHLFRPFVATVFGLMMAAGIPTSNALGADGQPNKPFKVNVNTATEAELEELPGIDSETAKKIIAARPYKNADELTRAGVTEKHIHNIHNHLLFEKINLNTATAKELDELPFVGPVMAKKIIANRPYANAQELAKAGLSEKKIAEIAPLVIFVDPPAPAVTTGAPLIPGSPATPATPAAPVAKVTPAPATPVTPATPAAPPAPIAKAPMPTTTPSPAIAKGDKEDKTVYHEDKIDVNTASVRELKYIPGLSEEQADKIVANRPYKNAEDLKKAGFSEERIASMSHKLSFETGAVPASSTISGAKKINVNTATLRELKYIPGLTEEEAEKIVANRPYKNAEDLKKAGMSQHRITENEGRLTFDEPKPSDKK